MAVGDTIIPARYNIIPARIAAVICVGSAVTKAMDKQEQAQTVAVGATITVSKTWLICLLI